MSPNRIGFLSLYAYCGDRKTHAKCVSIVSTRSGRSGNARPLVRYSIFSASETDSVTSACYGADEKQHHTVSHVSVACCGRRILSGGEGSLSGRGCRSQGTAYVRFDEEQCPAADVPGSARSRPASRRGACREVLGPRRDR